MSQAEEILDFIEQNISEYPNSIVDVTAKHFSVSRTTVHRHLSKLLKHHKVVKSGTTRDIKYFLANEIDREIKFKIDNSLDEYDSYNQNFKKSLLQFSENVETLCEYGFTEIFNNAIDHSYGSEIITSVEMQNNNIVITIIDDGIGVFKSIYDYFRLEDIRESVLQLSKGKMTTHPSDHSGEGIFFNSRAFDTFEIFSNEMHYIRDNIEDDWSLSSHDTSEYGTKVVMTVAANAKTDLIKIWKKYQDPETLEFDRTEIVVELSQLNQEKLISRSQAKRILMGVEQRFNVITLDFKGIKFVGQGFVDEVFRVFQNKNERIKIKYINANDDVTFMIERSLATNKSK